MRRDDPIGTDMKEYIPRLKQAYRTSVISQMMTKFNLENLNEVPKLEKIIVNVGVGEAKENIKALDVASVEISAITGQKPKVCRAKKSISNFKVRQGMPIGLKVTLRGDRMYEFLDRLISVAIPRIRDFHGIEPNAFDGNGNYNLGLEEQYIFPEVNVEKSDRARGMNITIVTSAENNEQAKELLTLIGMPFKKREQQ